MTVLILLLVALILLGCLMDSLSMILLTIPFFWPVLIELNGGDYVDSKGRTVDLAERKVIALIAYLERLGRDLLNPDVMATSPAPAAPSASEGGTQ